MYLAGVTFSDDSTREGGGGGEEEGKSSAHSLIHTFYLAGRIKEEVLYHNVPQIADVWFEFTLLL